MEVIITASHARQKVFEGKVDSVDSLLEASWSFVELLALPGITEKGQDALQDLVPFSFVEGELEAFLTLWSCETWVLYGAVTSSFVNSRFGAMIWVHCRLATRRGGCGGGPLILELQSSRSELCKKSPISPQWKHWKGNVSWLMQSFFLVLESLPIKSHEVEYWSKTHGHYVEAEVLSVHFNEALTDTWRTLEFSKAVRIFAGRNPEAGEITKVDLTCKTRADLSDSFACWWFGYWIGGRWIG